jgi:hypothetical protein
MTSRNLTYAALAFLLPLLCLGLIWRLDTSERSIEFDEGLFLYTADRIDRGVARYTDDFDNMPPGIYTLYRAAFRVVGNSPAASQLVSLTADLVILLLVFALGARLHGRGAGLAAAALYSVNFVTISWATKGSTENPMTALLLLALWLYLRAQSRERAGRAAWLVGSGACIAGAFLIKQPAVFFWLTPVGYSAYRVLTRQTAVRRAATDLAAAVVSFAAVLGAVALWLAAQGLLGAAIDNAFLFPLRMHRDYGMSLPVRLSLFVQQGVLAMPEVFLLCLLQLARRTSFTNADRLVPLLYIAPVGLFLLWTGDFFLHYLIQLIPGVALAAGIFIADAVRWPRRAWRVLIAVCLLLTGVGTAVRYHEVYEAKLPMHRRTAWFPSYYYDAPFESNRVIQLAIGRYLRTHLRPGERLLTTTPTFAYLARVPNSHSQFYVAQLTRAASNGFRGLCDAANDARFFVIERTRIPLLPPELHAQVAGMWRHGEAVCNDYYEVWENPRFAGHPDAPALDCRAR